MSKAAKAMKEAAAAPATKPVAPQKAPPKKPVVVKKAEKPSLKTTQQKPVVVAKKRSAMETMIDSAKRGVSSAKPPEKTHEKAEEEKREQFLQVLSTGLNPHSRSSSPLQQERHPAPQGNSFQPTQSSLQRPSTSLLYTAPLRGPEKKEDETSLKPSRTSDNTRPIGIGGFTIRTN